MVNKTIKTNNWKVQLAHKFEKKKLKENEWFSLSEKINGVRGTYYKGKIYSRQGKEISGLDHILDAIDDLNLPNMVFDGELVRENLENLPDNENFRIGTGIINSNEEFKTEINFIIFDMLPIKEFESGKSNQKYRERLENLNKLDLFWPLEMIPILYSGTDQNKINEYLKLMETADKEGLILNRNTEYKCNRNTGILKIKKFHTVDLEITKLEEGTGKIKGMLGAFITNYKGNKLKVGTGFTNEERVTFWKQKENLEGRVIEVKYFTESENKKYNKESLQFPTFIRLRELGKAVSYS
ncbi:MAG: hypothetical protein Pg6B_04470 [Candidatus Azobacteroides pseudotrichonymphae]|uniref:ATP-dependent DNA ligase n=1 Tax=Candidatus Improbicoccus pseudotrichonymphae TaxID=3033792 RepID=A0AA48IA42_9FIRM|nr:MAG: ATP-dependent DNA ligase [Candidatus Improbicoccus pseudotrichonymphae]GMO34038.1 MAG: hypothetical protein Pg6B_04470 [Candidatus Azobacteroides pseudotrichonymphae]